MDTLIIGAVTFTIGSFATIINVQRRKILMLRKALIEQQQRNAMIQERIYRFIWERGKRNRESNEVSES